ncbi:MAG: HAD family hydrolase [Nitrospirales bacterium]
MSQAEANNGVDWSRIDDVLLDMDGTLLDRHFDNFFFEEELPRRYAALHGLDVAEATQRLLALYRAVEGELNWTDLHYWTRILGLDVVALHKEFEHLITFHPDAMAFLEYLRTHGKRVFLVTNAHEAGLAIKLARTGLDRHVDRIVSAFEIGCLKMRPEFWPTCQHLIGFEPSRSLYVDDDEACLVAAHEHGIRELRHRSKSSSRLPPQPSRRYRSIETFAVLMGPDSSLA